MAQASLITLEPIERGGVPALTRTVYDILMKYGHTPHLIYSAIQEVPTQSRLTALKYFLTTPPVRRTHKEGMDSIAVADYPVAPRYKYHLLRLARQWLTAPITAVVSGSSHVGLPLALTNHPYLLWVATIYEDELQARVDAGDAWARNFLAGTDWKILEAQERLVYERANIILGLSPNTPAQIAARRPHVQQKLQTLYYPIDTGRFRPGTEPADPPYLLLTARIRDPRKNVNMLLKSFARVRAEFPRLRLIITGDEPLDSTTALAAQLNLSDSVKFIGHVSTDDLITLYQSATLFVFSSLQEGLGISVLDAMSCGIPVVSTRCGGPEGSVEDGITGLLTPSGDEIAFAQAILSLLKNPERARAMGAAARNGSSNFRRANHRETTSPRICFGLSATLLEKTAKSAKFFIVHSSLSHCSLSCLPPASTPSNLLNTAA